MRWFGEGQARPPLVKGVGTKRLGKGRITTANYGEKRVLLSWLTRTKNRFLQIHENKLKSVIKIQIAETSECIGLQKL